MFDVGESLQAPLDRARAALHEAQADVAAAAAGGTASRRADAAMAKTAQAAIFTEALLAAQHARLEEIKGVTR
ncbi:MAG: hypothetical protein JO192_10700 [Candidatus Eremiobacteraeota bacterium]|nr:hypothetical protein [Candidatus Eremiobacteraeota bacterium]MBV8333195.1 hypothetical protein [Candidatus Eremiobacteraeota bacterium]MBV8722490.1 hypothetical protein [Candidatus Eremiobacteraeota bacterium]